MKQLLLLFSVLILGLTISTAQSITWKEIGGLNNLSANNTINTVYSDDSSNVYAGGTFTNANNMEYVAAYKGNGWTELGGQNSLAANGYILSICGDANGNVYAAGNFKNASAKSYVAKFNGTTWSELGGTNSLAANSQIKSICIDAAGNLYAAGFFMNANGKRYVAKYDGTSWTELGGPNAFSANAPINTICTDAQGNIYAAGMFTNALGNYYVAKFDGTSWSELGGLNALAANAYINSICSDVSGNIYAAGAFTNATAKHYVAKFNGTSWSELGGVNALSANSTITAVCSDLAGNIYTAGDFTNTSVNHYVAKYNGTWSELGGTNSLAVIGTITSVCTNSKGKQYTAGYFLNSSFKHYVAGTQTCTPSYSNISKNICSGKSIVVNNKTYTKTGIYRDSLPNASGCDSFITIHLNVGLDTVKICMVTVDPLSTHNVIVWDKNPITKSSIDSFRIYRETATNTYSYIASVHRDSLSEYHDWGANPNTTSFKYKLSAIDSCGDILPFGHYHNSIHLQTLGNGNFQWTNYQIENEANPVNSYIMLRDDLSTGNFVAISNSIPGTNNTFTDVNFASYPNASYRMAVNWSIACTPTKSTSSTYSNILHFGGEGVQNILSATLRVSPNPTTETAIITLSQAAMNARVKLVDVRGRTVFQQENQAGSRFTIDLSNEAAGVYFIEIAEAGKVLHAKVVKE